jgi:hypothetical protein
VDRVDHGIGFGYYRPLLFDRFRYMDAEPGLHSVVSQYVFTDLSLDRDPCHYRNHHLFDPYKTKGESTMTA